MRSTRCRPASHKFCTSCTNLWRSLVELFCCYLVAQTSVQLHSRALCLLRRTAKSQVYDAFLAGEIDVPGKDLYDMSGAKGRAPDDVSVHNVMLPRRYFPAWQGNVFEQRCQVCCHCLHPYADLKLYLQHDTPFHSRSDHSAALNNNTDPLEGCQD